MSQKNHLIVCASAFFEPESGLDENLIEVLNKISESMETATDTNDRLIEDLLDEIDSMGWELRSLADFQDCPTAVFVRKPVDNRYLR